MKHLFSTTRLAFLGRHGSASVQDTAQCIWFLGVLIVFLAAAPAIAAERTLRALLEGDEVFPTLNISAAGENGTANSILVADCPEFDGDEMIGAYRFEVEIVMICNVVRDYDLADRNEFGSYPTRKRGFAELIAGRADMFAESVFMSAAEDGILVSDPVLLIGDFKVGVFTTPDRADVLQVSTPEELRELRGVTVNNWPIDVKTLEGMGLRSVITSRRSDLIPAMIEAGRADFTLSYLDRPTTDHMGAQLKRVDGFRVSLIEERALAFNASNTLVVEALNEFIRMNRQAPVDRIRRAYERAGFIVDRYDDWLDVTSPHQ